MGNKLENLLPVAGIALGAGLAVVGGVGVIENGSGVANAAQSVVTDSLVTKDATLIQKDKQDLGKNGGNLILGILETAGGIAIVLKSAASIKE